MTPLPPSPTYKAPLIKIHLHVKKIHPVKKSFGLYWSKKSEFKEYFDQHH